MHWLDFGAVIWIEIIGVILITFYLTLVLAYTYQTHLMLKELKANNKPLPRNYVHRPICSLGLSVIGLISATVEFNHLALFLVITAVTDSVAGHISKRMLYRHRQQGR